MKILYIAPIRLPTEKAHGIQIMETCAALMRAGADVELLIPNRKTPIKDGVFEYYAIDERFAITRLRAPDTVSWGRFGFLLHVLVFGIRAALYARKKRADFVYTRDPATLLILQFLGVTPLAWEVHTAHPLISPMIVNRIPALIAITQGLANWYVARGLSPDAVHVAPDAVNLHAFAGLDRTLERKQLRARLNLPENASIALYLGSFGLYAWKGVDVARTAAEFAPEIVWLLVGGTNVERESVMIDARQNVRTLERVSRADVPKLLCAADVLLLPNKSGDPASERDTSPMKLFEYMASGVPIVSSDVASLREILHDGSAFLVPPNSAEALARGVRRALSSPSDARKRAATAYTEAQRYTWDRRAAGILGFLKARRSL